MKLWYDENEDQKFDRNTDSWFAKFKLGRTKKRGKFDFSDLTGKQFIKKIDRTIYLDFAFPNEHYLNKHKDSDKYLFDRTDELKALLFKTLAKWDGYKGIGLEKPLSTRDTLIKTYMDRSARVLTQVVPIQSANSSMILQLTP